MKTRTFLTLLMLSAATGLAACSANPRTDADFGNSVRQMQAAQAYVTGPLDTSPVETGDGERIDNVLDAYRNSVSRPTEVQAPIVLDLGGSAAR